MFDDEEAVEAEKQFTEGWNIIRESEGKAKLRFRIGHRVMTLAYEEKWAAGAVTDLMPEDGVYCAELDDKQRG